MIDKISVNTQSSIKINGSKTIYFDPYKIEEENHDADYIFITHNHYDHYDKEAIKKLMNDNSKLVIPDSMASDVLGIFPSKNIIGVVPNEYYELDNLKVETIPSYNIDKEYHPKKMGWVGYVIELDGERIYVAGDTDITEENKQVTCSIAFLPIGGTYTMNSKEAAVLTNIIRPKIVIPTHYGSIVGTKNDEIEFLDNLDKDIVEISKLK